MARILAFTATYNEVDNIEELIRGIRQYVADADVLVVDDASPDGTGELLDRLAERESGLHVIHRPGKLGLGTAHILAMQYAIHNHYDILITMDADFSHNPQYMPTLLKLLEENDFVTGSRYMPGGHCDYGFIRTFVSKTANHLVRLLLSIPTHETTTSFRGFHVSLLRRMDLDSLRGEGYSFFMEAIFLVHRISRRMAEFPIHFEDRRAGTSKISKREIIKAMFNLGRVTFRRFFILPWAKKYHREPAPHPLIPCENCQSPYSMEIIPARNGPEDDAATFRCTSTEHRTHGSIRKCLNCGLAFNATRHDADALLSLYEDVEDPTYLENLDARLRTFRYNFSKIKKYLPKAGRLLDIGSYCGASLKVAREFGLEPLGIEPSRWAAAQCQEQLKENVIQGTLADLPDEAGTFDMVTLWDVLEHLPHPVETLHRIQTRLKPGGVLAFSTLDIENWYPRLLQDRWPWYMDMHLYYFTVNSLKQMLDKTGFDLVDHHAYTHIITLEYFFWKLKALGVPGAGALHKLVGRTPLKRIMLPFRFGDIQLFVCRKRSHV